MAQDLEYGDKGDEVRELQEFLSSLGYTEVGNPDGEYFHKTQSAVWRFQSEHGIEATGRADHATRSAIEHAHIEGMQHAMEQSIHGQQLWPTDEGPAEGFTRITLDAENHVDFETNDVVNMYVDNNLVNFAIQPIPVTLEILSQPISLYYASGAELHLPTLSTIGDGYDDGSYICYVSSGYLVATCDRNFQPMYNAFTTPRLHWLKWRLLDKTKELAAQQLEVVEVVAAFAEIVALYGQLDNSVGFANLGATGHLPGALP